jgi:hypothetical protein
LLCRQIPSPKPANLDKEPDDSDDPPSPDPNNVTNPGTPDTVAVAAVCQVLASGRDTSALDLTNPLVLCALTSVVNASAEKAKSPGMLTPDSTGVNLLPATEPPQAASPSIRRCLANATSTMLPPCVLRSLGFLDNQALLDANFPTNDRKPIISLFSPRASATTRSKKHPRSRQSRSKKQEARSKKRRRSRSSKINQGSSRQKQGIKARGKSKDPQEQQMMQGQQGQEVGGGEHGRVAGAMQQ